MMPRHDVTEPFSDEHQRLRRTMRDLVALSTLPAVWSGYAPARLIQSLADVLLDALALDIILVRVTGREGQRNLNIVRSQHRPPKTEDELALAVDPLLAAAANAAQSSAIADPF